MKQQKHLHAAFILAVTAIFLLFSSFCIHAGQVTDRVDKIFAKGTIYRPPIYYYISKRSLTLLNFCLDKGVHFIGSRVGG